MLFSLLYDVARVANGCGACVVGVLVKVDLSLAYVAWVKVFTLDFDFKFSFSSFPMRFYQKDHSKKHFDYGPMKVVPPR